MTDKPILNIVLPRKPGRLRVVSFGEIVPRKKTGATLWRQFLAGGSFHSGEAGLVPYIVNRCEREGIPYILEAVPGHGYGIRPAVQPAETQNAATADDLPTTNAE